jgi:hypothetical protein
MVSVALIACNSVNVKNIENTVLEEAKNKNITKYSEYGAYRLEPSKCTLVHKEGNIYAGSICDKNACVSIEVICDGKAVSWRQIN